MQCIWIHAMYLIHAVYLVHVMGIVMLRLWVVVHMTEATPRGRASARQRL